MKKFKKLIALVVIILLAGITFVLLRNLKIKKVDCKNQYSECADSVLQKLKPIVGQNILLAKKNLDKILIFTPLVYSYSVSYKPPTSFFVNIVERKAVFVINFDKAKSFSLVDADGTVFGYANETQLPILYIDDPKVMPDFKPNVGTKLTDSLKLGGDLLLQMRETYNINSLRTTESNFEAIMPSGIKILFPTSGDRDYLMGALVLILYRLNNDPQKTRIDSVKDGLVHEIDLRFKNPVVR